MEDNSMQTETTDTAGDVETRTIQLRKPIMDVEGEMVSELTMREPTPLDLKHIEGVKGGEFSRVNALLARCCGVPASSLLRMKMRDYTGLVEALGELGFSEPGSESEE